jgi:hypothetical protein
MANRGRSTRSIIGLFGLVMLFSVNASAKQAGQPVPPPLPNTGGGFGPVQPPAANPPVDTPPPPQVPGVPTQPGTAPPFLNPQALSQPAGVPRFNFKIDAKTPTKDLLPAAPKVAPINGPLLTDDLAKVPEAEFQARAEKAPAAGKSTEQAAFQLAKINHMNAKKPDAFMTALIESRPDLAGLPFAMGDTCRTIGERTKQFTAAVNTVRQALNGAGNRVVVAQNVTVLTQPAPGGAPTPVPVQATQFLAPPQATGGSFWSQYATLCEQEDAARPRPDKDLLEHVTLARMAALMQMLAPETVELRLGLVKYLTGVPHVEATKALARMAIFSAEDDIRAAAIEALKVRKEKDYTDVLVMGLRYPWPAVAKRSADAIAKLGRTDLVNELIAVLDETDPRMPAVKEMGGKKVLVVREMVKINHHRNCMMCHSPGSPETGTGSAITAEVPVQDQPLPLPSEGYRQSSPDMMVRIDVTYLRQDFSALMPVADAHPWPEMQRFDFLVRERKLTDDEVVVYRDKLTPKEVGVLSPYHKAALAALREITGKDTAPTAEAWRKLLAQSPKSTTPG